MDMGDRRGHMGMDFGNPKETPSSLYNFVLPSISCILGIFFSINFFLDYYHINGEQQKLQVM